MASMVAKACSSTSSQMPALAVQDKGSRNKRKFRADPPLADLSKIIPFPQNECANFEISPNKFEIVPDHNSHTNGCDVCCVNQDSSDPLKLDLGLSCVVGTSKVGPSRPTEEIEPSTDESYDADWSDLTESQLEELILSNLDAIFKSAVKKIIASGYSEDVASEAILRSGVWYGCKDTVTNIVENTLAFLRSGQEIDPSREHYFEDLQQMEKYILAELVCLLKEVRPFFSTGDAMWCLLICDMNVSHACAMDSEPFGSFLGDAAPNGNSNVSIPCKPNTSLAYTQKSNEAPNETNGLVRDEECLKSVFNINEKPFCATGISNATVAEEKLVACSKKVSGISKREHVLRQKSIYFERYRTHGSKGTSRSGKLSTFSSLLLDKKLKQVADSTGINAKNSSFKIGKSVGLCDVPQTNGNNYNLEMMAEGSSLPVGPTNPLPSLPVADTELSLSFPIANPMPISYNTEAVEHEWAAQNKKDEMIMKLIPRVKELQNQLEEWTEWANQKVMQAARRLGKDKAELKTLKQEKEEVERLRKEKQTLEDNTMKKLSEMENALYKASGQVERANGTVRRLEVENNLLRRELEAAKRHAAESAASCREVSEREKRTLMKFQTWEKQKSVLQEDLAVERRELMQLGKKLEQAKDAQDLAVMRLNQEEKAKNESLTQATSFRKEREQIEASAKTEEDVIKSRAESTLLKYKEDIQKLEKDISQLRLKTDSSKIAALRRGIDGLSYAGKVPGLEKAQAHKDSSISYISRTVTSSDLHDSGVKRERECVMCLSEEMSVVFFPCAHQVVCVVCNELHERQGMKDCPSCRSTIQRRVCVRFACP